jgi:hypothetical protein
MVTSHEPDKSPDWPNPEPAVAARVPLRLNLSDDLGHGRLHGAWWPQSRDLETELVDLAGGLPAALGRVVRVVYSRPDWNLAPRKVTVDDTAIQVGSFPQDDSHLVILTLSTRNLSLLVVPQDTDEEQAEEAMDVAASPANHASARDILVPRTARAPLPVAQRWDDAGAPWWAPNPVPPSYRVRDAPARTGRRSTRGPANTPSRPAIVFHDDHGVFTGRSESGRAWRISPELTGWRLEFRDAGDRVATNAGLHRSVAAAIAEASR